MHVEHLMTFAAVAHLRSFTRAAHVLSLSQSAVSQQIRELELYFGQTLFARTTRRLALTPAGERLLLRATEMIGQLKAAKSELGHMSGRQGGQLAIGATSNIAIYRLPPILSELQRQADPLRLSVQVGPLPLLAQGFRSGELEVVLAAQPLQGIGRADFCHDVFATDELCAIVGPAHPWAGSEIDAAELLAEPLVACREGSPAKALVADAFKALGLPLPRIAVELGSTEAIKHAVEEGLGFGFASRCAVAQDLAQGRLGEVKVRDLAISRELWLITEPESRRTDRAESFRILLLARSGHPAANPVPCGTRGD